MDKDQIEQRWDGTMGQTAISCTDRKRPGSLPELRLTVDNEGDPNDSFADSSAESTRCKKRRERAEKPPPASLFCNLQRGTA
jgi:hypothetical protein